jgi:hypothetical protein
MDKINTKDIKVFLKVNTNNKYEDVIMIINMIDQPALLLKTCKLSPSEYISLYKICKFYGCNTTQNMVNDVQEKILQRGGAAAILAAVGQAVGSAAVPIVTEVANKAMDYETQTGKLSKGVSTVYDDFLSGKLQKGIKKTQEVIPNPLSFTPVGMLIGPKFMRRKSKKNIRNKRRAQALKIKQKELELKEKELELNKKINNKKTQNTNNKNINSKIINNKIINSKNINNKNFKKVVHQNTK